MGRAVVQVRLTYFANPDNVLHSGIVCDRSTSSKLCDYKFTVSVGNNGKYGNVISSPELHDRRNEVTERDFQAVLPQNYLTFTVDEPLPVRLTF